MSDEHFSVDGTLIEAWASQKSVVRKDGTSPTPETGGRNPTVNFKGEKRSNETHASRTDPEARLYRKRDGATLGADKGYDDEEFALDDVTGMYGQCVRADYLVPV